VGIHKETTPGNHSLHPIPILVLHFLCSDARSIGLTAIGCRIFRMKQITTPLFKHVNTIVSSDVNKDNPACTPRNNSCSHLSFLPLRIEISSYYVSEQLHTLQGENSLLARNIQSHALGCLFLEFSLFCLQEIFTCFFFSSCI
jgi:hypothetical protein